jgi:hypothetical protein
LEPGVQLKLPEEFIFELEIDEPLKLSLTEYEGLEKPVADAVKETV